MAYPWRMDQKKTWGKWQKDNPKVQESLLGVAIDNIDWIPSPVPFGVIKSNLKKAGFSLNEDKRAEQVQERSLDAAKTLASTIDANTSIESLGAAMWDQGLDDQVIYDVVREMQDNGEIELQDFQEQEVMSAKPAGATLNDLWNNISLNPSVERPRYGIWDSIKRIVAK